MDTFQIGETVVCYCEIRKSGNLYDPTSVKIDILKEDGTSIVSNTDTTKEAVGKYNYNFDSASKSSGKYRFRITATDSGKVSKKDSVFRLES